MSFAVRIRLRASNFARSGTTFARLCLLPLAIVVAAFFLLPMDARSPDSLCRQTRVFPGLTLMNFVQVGNIRLGQGRGLG
jgi:hypothetical protein